MPLTVTSPAVAESATDHADQHVSQYHESDSATSISNGMYIASYNYANFYNHSYILTCILLLWCH